MVDQIIDKRTIGIPGPQGKPGPQGLPGVNAVDNDTAVSSYIHDLTSKTSLSIQSTSGYANAIAFGADPTGVADSATAINNALAACQGVYLPSGSYIIKTHVTLNGAGLYALPGAKVTAAAAMDSMVVMHQPSDEQYYTRRVELAGGEWDGNQLADRIITGDANNCITIRDCSLRNAATLHADLSAAHGVKMDHVFIDGWNRQVDGVSLNVDCHLDGVKIFRCCKGFILPGGVNFFNACYIWGGGSDKQLGRHTYGFYGDSANTIIGSNLYLDCLQDGFYGVGSSTWDILMPSCFIYANPTDMDDSLPCNVFNIPSGSVVRMPGAKISPARNVTLAPNMLAPSDLDTRMDVNKITDPQNYRTNYNYAYMRQKIDSTKIDLPQNSYYYLCTATYGASSRFSQIVFSDSIGWTQFTLETCDLSSCRIRESTSIGDYSFYMVADSSSKTAQFYLKNTGSSKPSFMTREYFKPVDYESTRLWIDPAQTAVLSSLPSTATQITPS